MKHFLKIITVALFPLVIGVIVNSDDVVMNESGNFTTYPEHIAGAYTGGFGEQSCHSCHFDYDLNQPAGELSVSGIDEVFEAGQEYKITLNVKREDMSLAGFQMTARFEDGSQAGRFELNEDLTTTPNIDNTISYLQHAVGKVEAENGKKKWQITWTAPDQADQPVIINIAANAANGDASAFGDWIYLKEIKTDPKE